MNPTDTRLDAETAATVASSLREVFAGSGDLSGALEELGWAEVFGTDPATATTLLFLEQGRALVSSRLLDSVLLDELAADLPEATGPRALLYPDPHTGVPADPGGPLTGLLLGPLDGVTEVVVPVAAGEDPGDPAATEAGAAGAGVTLHILPAEVLARATRPAGAFDAGSGWLLVEAGPVGAAGPGTAATAAWGRALAAGRRALAAEIIGVSQAALELATAHITNRVQYGQPIGAFQAVRHRLAESHVAIEAARSSLEAAWAAAAAAPKAGNDERAIWAARLAKLHAGRAQAEVLRHAVQVSGAMGLTLEGEMHRHVTRAATLDALLDGYRVLSADLGAALLAGADLDPVVEIRA